jgi:hypothetical protein
MLARSSWTLWRPCWGSVASVAHPRSTFWRGLTLGSPASVSMTGESQQPDVASCRLKLARAANGGKQWAKMVSRQPH